MSESADRELLDLIRRSGPLTVADMARRLAVTGTAVRNRLSRLLATGLVEASPSMECGGGPGTAIKPVSRLTSVWGRTMPTWPWRSGRR